MGAPALAASRLSPLGKQRLVCSVHLDTISSWLIQGESLKFRRDERIESTTRQISVIIFFTIKNSGKVFIIYAGNK